MKNIGFIKLLVIFVFVINLNCETVKIYKPKEIKFAQKFSLKFEFPDHNHTDIIVSTLPLNGTDFEYIDIKKIKGGFEIYLIPFNIGISTFPALDILLNPGSISIKSYPVNLEIKPLYNPDPSKGIKPIAPIYSFLLWLKILLGLIILAILWWIIKKYLSKKNKNNLLSIAIIDTRTPYQKAMDTIKELKNSNYLKEGKIKEYYTILSDIIRKYITEQYQVNAIKLTTSDTIKALKEKISINIAIKIREFLDVSDMVKFAKYIPEIKRAEDDIEFVTKIIEELENIIIEKRKKEEEKTLNMRAEK